MNQRSRPINCIIPPHILRNIAERGDEQQRKKAINSLMAGAHFRARREMAGKFLFETPAGVMRRSIHDCVPFLPGPWFLPGLFVRGEGDPSVNDQAVNEAYDSLGHTYKFYKDVFGRNSIDNKGMRLIASVHYCAHFGEAYDNAFWNGSQMVFGDGDGKVFAVGGFTKAIEVIGHELTHGVTEHECKDGLEYRSQSGALNESMSDVFGSLVKQYTLNQTVTQADWLIGSGILAPGIKGVALRSMKDPGTAYDDPLLHKDPQPGHMRDYVKTTEDAEGVHINSGIPNRAFYLVAEQLGGYAWEYAGKIWYDTLRQLHAQADFQEAANVTFQVAGGLYGAGSRQQQAVGTAWDTVGLPVAGARRAAAPIPVGANGAHLEQKIDDLVSAVGRLVDVLGKKV